MQYWRVLNQLLVSWLNWWEKANFTSVRNTLTINKFPLQCRSNLAYWSPLILCKRQTKTLIVIIEKKIFRIERLFETGITLKLIQNDLMKIPHKDSDFIEPKAHQSLSVKQFQGTFLILFIGHMISMVVFGCEVSIL